MSDDAARDDLADDIASLLATLGARALTPPLQVASGWESVIWRADSDRGRLAVRILAAEDPAIGVREADVIRRLHTLAYPVPAILGTGRVGRRTAIVMEFVEGTDLWSPERSPEESLGILSELMARLHALDVTSFDVPSDPLAWILDGARRTRSRFPGFSTAAGWILDRAAGIETIGAACHLDLPPNVIVTPARGPFVVDWTSFRITDPRLDLAWSRLLLEMYGADGDADRLAEIHASRDPASVEEREFFSVCAAFRRLAIVADLLDGAAHEADDLESHLPLMQVPLQWIRRHTGTTVPEVEAWIGAA